MNFKSKHQINMCSGSIFGKMIVFAIPLMLTGILQLFYNAADIIIVGRYSGKEALSAVGATGAIINLLINVFLGLSIGTSVTVSRFFGSSDYDGIEETVHTSISIAAIAGVCVGIGGFLLAKPLLSLMDTPFDVIDGATLYMRIYFIGMPFNMLYNFGSAILRAVGDTRRPLYFLTISGIFNVVLNIIFVVQFDMGVAGVATATIIAQAISMTLVLRCLMLSDGALQLRVKNLKIHKDKLKIIVRIGIPAGIQASFFSLSNVLIQSSINSFGSVVVAANTTASNLEGFVYTAMNSIYQTTLTFTSQNIGANQYKRARSIFWNSLVIVFIVGITMGGMFILFGRDLLGLYNNDPEVIAMGYTRLVVICTTYFFCGIMEVIVGQLRGFGYSIMPMIVSLCGICVFRIFWIYTAFAVYPNLMTLYVSYPISWVLTSFIHFTCYMIILRKFPKENEAVQVIN